MTQAEKNGRQKALREILTDALGELRYLEMVNTIGRTAKELADMHERRAIAMNTIGTVERELVAVQNPAGRAYG